MLTSAAQLRMAAPSDFCSLTGPCLEAHKSHGKSKYGLWPVSSCLSPRLWRTTRGGECGFTEQAAVPHVCSDHSQNHPIIISTTLQTGG